MIYDLRSKAPSFKLRGILASFFLLPLIFHFSVSAFHLNEVRAESMTNGLYNLEWGSFEPLPAITQSSDQKQLEKEKPADETASNNYHIKEGYPEDISREPYILTLSTEAVEFGSFNPTYPVKRSLIISINNTPLSGYTISTYQNHRLLVPTSGSIIPDTTCDNGNCNESQSGPWFDNGTSLTYGFGYRCEPVDINICSGDFDPANYYKQFPDSSLKEVPEAVIISLGEKAEEKSEISYKVNISASQPGGIYNNIVTYLATPGY